MLIPAATLDGKKLDPRLEGLRSLSSRGLRFVMLSYRINPGAISTWGVEAT